MSFVIRVAAGLPSDGEVLSVRDTDTTLHFQSIEQQQFYGQFDDKLDDHIFALHPDFIPTTIKAKLEKVIKSSSKVPGITLDDVVIAPAAHRFILGSKVVLDIRHKGKLVGTLDPDFKLRSIKRQRLSKKFVRTSRT